jgi:hypothetical protein
MLNKIQNEKEAKLIVEIESDLLGTFIKEYKTDENILFKNSLYIESLRDLLNIFLKRYDIYESKMVKGIDYFIESFITIINYDLSNLTIAKKIPIFKNGNNIFIGNSELFIKTMKNLDKTIEFFFNRNRGG